MNQQIYFGITIAGLLPLYTFVSDQTRKYNHEQYLSLIFYNFKFLNWPVNYRRFAFTLPNAEPNKSQHCHIALFKFETQKIYSFTVTSTAVNNLQPMEKYQLTSFLRSCEIFKQTLNSNHLVSVVKSVQIQEMTSLSLLCFCREAGRETMTKSKLIFFHTTKNKVEGCTRASVNLEKC